MTLLVDSEDSGVAVLSDGGGTSLLTLGSQSGSDEAVGDKFFQYDFSSLSIVSVDHNLNKYPAVSVIDSAGDQVEGAVQHLNLNTAIITFSAPFSGKAIFN